ncbi:uncharacterized protein DMAD_01223 [Drosophila madeirensis]|uniref:Uncharacterized protein n=1 Tax=Drosophila madeirensis TaxID=30013 RepID=A0AAU9G1B1_DROMD
MMHSGLNLILGTQLFNDPIDDEGMTMAEPVPIDDGHKADDENDSEGDSEDGFEVNESDDEFQEREKEEERDKMDIENLSRSLSFSN